VPVDVGKSSAMVMACDFTGRTIRPPVGVEAAGHYHQPVIAPGVWPQDWQVVELNPAHVTAQRRVNGSRGVKTDRIDLTAITDLLLAGGGTPVIVGDMPLLELQAWVVHRRRRLETRTATKNQLLGQLDRAFPGLGATLADVLGSEVGRLVATHVSDPARLARLGPGAVARLGRPPRRAGRPADGRAAGDRDRRRVGHPGGAVARELLAADLARLDDFDAQIRAAEARIGALLPATATRS
jgi:transposase